MTPSDVQAILRHANIETTGRYLTVRVEDIFGTAVVATADLGMAATTVRAVLLAGASYVLAAASRLGLLTMAESLAVVARDAGRVLTPFHSQFIAHRGACGKTRVVPQTRWLRPGKHSVIP